MMQDTTLIKLREKFTIGEWNKNPGEYTQLDRTDKSAIYEVKDDGFIHYEVFRVYIQNDFAGELRRNTPQMRSSGRQPGVTEINKKQ